MHSDNPRYQEYSSNSGSRNGGSRHAAPGDWPLEHELYPDVTARQNPQGGDAHQRQHQTYDAEYGYGQPYATTRQPVQPRQARQGMPQGRDIAANGVTRQTAADLGQVDNSQVAGRVAYDQDGNLVVVKKEEKKAPVQMAAIVGSALSAVTSALFSSHIGIGGSLLTVAIGAAVSAAGTQLYTHIIAKSTDKLKSAIDSGPGSQQLVGVMDSSQLDEGGYGYEAQQTVYGFESEEGTPTADGGRIAPQGMIDAASEEHDRQVKRRGIIIVAIAALVAVIVAAGVVTWATQGNGIGTKTPSIVSTATNTANENENTNANAANATQAPEASTATTSAGAGQEAGGQSATSSNANAGSTSSSAANQAAGSTTTSSTPSASGSSASGSGTTGGSASSTATNATGAGGSSTASGSNGSGSAANASGATAGSGSANANGSPSASNSAGTGSATGDAGSTTGQASTAE